MKQLEGRLAHEGIRGVNLVLGATHHPRRCRCQSILGKHAAGP